MKHWQTILKQSITQADQLAHHFDIDPEPLKKIGAIYPMRINSYYLNMIRKPGDPFWLQAVPDEQELQDTTCLEDPLDEENLSPVPNLVHKYPDRALFLVTSQCAMYCRFCTRKRKVGTDRMIINQETFEAGLEYLKKTPAIRDVLVSGGDPLLLEDNKIEWLLTRLRQIRSIEIIRIGTRVPCTLPMRVTLKLAKLLQRYHPLYINTHFNHPDEITPEATLACKRLADAGIPLGCQTVLLRGINDNSETIKKLMHKLLCIRVKPYYIFQTDMTKGTNHFRTPVEKGIEIVQSLIGHTSGMAVPTFAIDAPGGGGKIPLLPEYITQFGNNIVFTNYKNVTCCYQNVPIL